MDLHLSLVHACIGGHGLDPVDDLGESGAEIVASAATRPEDPVLTAAVLVATAFRMRDEQGLTRALRLLATAVGSWEGAQAAGALS